MSTTDSGRVSVPAQAGPHPTPHTVIDLDAPRPARAVTTRTDRVRDAIHAGACVLAGALVTIGFALDTSVESGDGAALVREIAQAPDRFYWANVIGAFGLVLVAAVGLAVMRLVRARARVLATVGGMMMIIGGAAAAAGIFMYGAVLTGMVESGLELEQMGALQDSLSDSARPGIAFMIGFPGFLLGLLLCVVALAMSHEVARWVPAALTAGLVVVMAFGETDFSFVGDLLLTAGFTGIGLTLWRATAPTRTG